MFSLTSHHTTPYKIININLVPCTLWYFHTIPWKLQNHTFPPIFSSFSSFLLRLLLSLSPCIFLFPTLCLCRQVSSKDFHNARFGEPISLHGSQTLSLLLLRCPWRFFQNPNQWLRFQTCLRTSGFEAHLWLPGLGQEAPYHRQGLPGSPQRSFSSWLSQDDIFLTIFKLLINGFSM